MATMQLPEIIAPYKYILVCCLHLENSAKIVVSKPTIVQSVAEVTVKQVLKRNWIAGKAEPVQLVVQIPMPFDGVIRVSNYSTRAQQPISSVTMVPVFLWREWKLQHVGQKLLHQDAQVQVFAK